MNAKIHALQVEIRNIENMLSSLNGAMQEFAMDEVKNMRFELDLLNRAALKANKPQQIIEAKAEEAGVYA